MLVLHRRALDELEAYLLLPAEGRGLLVEDAILAPGDLQALGRLVANLTMVGKCGSGGRHAHPRDLSAALLLDGLLVGEGVTGALLARSLPTLSQASRDALAADTDDWLAGHPERRRGPGPQPASDPFRAARRFVEGLAG